MLATIAAIAPIFLTIALGYALYRARVLSEEMWSGVDILCFYVLFPALFVRTVANAQFTGLDVWPLVIGTMSGVLVSAGLMLLARPLLRQRLAVSDPSFTSLFQGVVRWHAFFGLAIVTALYGPDGITLIAIVILALIPLLNAMTIAVLVRFGSGQTSPNLASGVRQVALNPLILSVVAGGILNLTGIGLPRPAREVVDFLASGALGISLLAVGAGLRPLEGGGTGRLVLGCALRLVVHPAIMWVMLTLAGVDGLALTIGVLSAAVPTAVNAYILARRMGGDAPLMASLITAQVLASAVTLPVILWLLTPQ
ncbi:MAG: AEC family transporter [Rhizobiales bacterium]|nr:AEC family transporter [Hyphomicrobiales bacterium]